MKDSLFMQKPTKQFEFDESVASVFDDMLNRSIPFYEEQIKLLAHFASLELCEGGRVYDLGSSTGNVLFALSKLAPKAECIGLDSSYAMIARSMLKSLAYGGNVHFEEANFLDYEFLPSKVMIANYTMQFVRPLQREKMIKRIFDALEMGGVFLMGEKVISHEKVLDRAMIDYYYSYKSSQGYSQIEIAQKREALENVLIPYTQEENFAMLKNAGFSHIEILFRWVNFALIFAKKGH
ncbi:carboxy-S-adenosyl-L-methionine synthase CmoA [Helicobacter pametensis]|uniref:carboxy-S-adenosyl-L-methionine synthase CmoA n=1 Tax=Helicobacter pametensis TaxID=95149 RepID=UPI000484F04F|nr:carboxy-S-adenosyl-L-methionine synthase CmoA [Helicobacter pametensis]